MLNRVSKITSIVSLAIYSLFAVLACYVFGHTALDTCYVINRADNSGFYQELGSFNPQAIIFIVATVILLSALIFHIIRVIKPQKLVYSIICITLSIISVAFFLTLNIDARLFMFIKYILHIQNEFRIRLFDVIKPITTTFVLISEITAIIFAVMCKFKSEENTGLN
jgi:hypothetical protein